MSFEEKLRQWIMRNYGTIVKFADELQMKTPNVSRYINGSRKPGYHFIKKIRHLGCDLNWLFDD